MPNDNEAKPVRSWQEIAAAAAKETDSKKLLQLAPQLEQAFAERDKKIGLSAKH